MSLTTDQRSQLLRDIRANVLQESTQANFRGTNNAKLPDTTKVQQQIAYLSRLNPSAASYTTGFTLSFHGVVNVGKLEDALAEVVSRHDALRTRFFWQEGELKREVFQSLDVRLNVESSVNIDIDAEAYASRAFDIAEAPLWKAVLLHDENSGREVLVWTASHSIFDGFSMNLVAEELAALYQGFSVAPVKHQMSDLPQFEHEIVGSDELQKLLAYWKSVVKPQKAMSLADLKNDVQSMQSAFTIHEPLPNELLSEVDTYARSRRTTRSAVLLSAYIAVLHRLSGDKEITVGVPLDGRYKSKLRGVVGNLVNTLPVQVTIGSPMSFNQLVDNASSLLTQTIEHQALPLSMLIDELSPTRDGLSPPLFSTIFNFTGLPEANGFDFGPDLKASLAGLSNSSSRFDYELSIDSTADGVRVRFEYDKEKVSTARAKLIVSAFSLGLNIFVQDSDTPIADIPQQLLCRLSPNGASPHIANKGATQHSESTAEIMRTIEPIWRKTLGSDCDIDKNFFASGGTSLAAVPMTNEISESIGVEVPLVDVLTADSLSEVAEIITSLKNDIQ